MPDTRTLLGISIFLILLCSFPTQGAATPQGDQDAPEELRVSESEVNALAPSMPESGAAAGAESPLELKTSATLTQKRRPHYWRNTLELAMVIAGGTTWYWLDRERQVGDWDYPKWKDKILFRKEVMIFDTNPFQVNFAWHTYAGAASHLVGRSNGLGLYQAAGSGVLASMVWEYAIESRERISVNDLLFTNMVGVPTGEFFHRIGQYVNQGQQGFGWDVARWTAGFGHTLHANLDNQSVMQDEKLHGNFRWYYALDQVGISRQDGGAGTEANEADKTLHSVGFAGRMVALDDYKQPGHRQGFFGEANVSDFSMQLTQGQGTGTRAEGDALLLGWTYQDAPEEGEGLGIALNLGADIGYFYHREQFGLWQDRFGGLHIPGPGVDAEVYGDNWSVTGQLYGNVDFVGVNSMPWQQFIEVYEEPMDGAGPTLGKTVLRQAGYYYGLGYSTRAKAEVQVDRFALGGKVFLGSYDSIEGLERDKIAVPSSAEAKGEDTVVDLDLWLRAGIYENSYAQLRVGRYFREGTLAEFEAKADMTRANLEIGVQF